MALAAASVVLLAPPARKAGRRLSLRKRRAMVVSRLWIYGAAATICVALTAGAMWWVGGWADIPMASAETAAQGTAEGPVDITVSPDAGRIEVSNTAPVALLVLAYPEPAAEVMVDRRFAVVPSKGSQVFGLLQGIRAEGSAMRLVIAPALVAGDWLYPLARELGACGGFVALSAIQFGLAAVLLGGLDLALAGLRR